MDSGKPIFKVILLFIGLVINSHLITAQQNALQLKNFADFDVQQNVVFSTDVPQPLGSVENVSLKIPTNANAVEHETTLIDLKMNIYEPKDDMRDFRPVLVLCFGGGFLEGSKGAGDMITLAETFAKRGFVTTTIDYRVGFNVFDATAAQRSLYRATQDSRAAIRFLRWSVTQGNPYRITPDQIYIVGPSAGGITALHNVYLDEDERTPSTFATTYKYSSSPLIAKKTYEIPNLECLDCAGQYNEFSGKADGAIAFAGAIGDLNFIENSNEKPVLLFHSEDDNLVPFDSGVPYVDSPFTAIPVVYGSNAIYSQAKNVGAPVEFVRYENRGHNVHSSDGTLVYPDVIETMEDFLVRQISKATTTLGTETIISEEVFQIANPISTSTTWSIKIEPGSLKNVYLTNLQGQRIQSFERVAQNDKVINFAPIDTSGIYILTGQKTDGSFSSQKILVH